MTVAEMTLKAKQRSFRRQLHRCTPYRLIRAANMLARVQTKRQGRYYESLKIEAFSVCGMDRRALRLSFFRTDVRRFINANHTFLTEMLANQNGFYDDLMEIRFFLAYRSTREYSRVHDAL